MPFFKHEQAIVDTSNIGEGTKIWEFVHILPNAVIGKNCNICAQVFIENDVIIGDNVTVKCGVYVWDGVRLQDNVFLGPNVTFTNDIRPRSKQYPAGFAKTVIEEGASVGANVTIIAGNTIGRYSMIGAGSVVTKSIPNNTLWYGNPATFKAYICNCGENLDAALCCTSCNKTYMLNEGNFIVELGGTTAMGVDKVKLIELPKIYDPRGNLSVIETGRHIPFDFKRIFYLYDVPGGTTRAGHANVKLEQVLIAMSGSFDVTVDDGFNKLKIHLNRSYQGLYIPGMIWREIDNFSSASVCLVLASDFYDESDYYRDYGEFIQAACRAQGELS